MSLNSSGCDAVGRAVASNTREKQFESHHWHENALYGHISLNVPNVGLNFDVSVDSIQFLTHASKT